jgi:hypothetical protein
VDDAGIAAARAEDIPPLSHEEATRILAATSGVNAVLVGGQAVNFWARLLDDPELADAETLLTSKDIDFEGRPDQARVCAQLLGGQAKLFKPPSLTSAEVYFRDSDGYPRVIDFLTSPGGVNGREVMDTAVPITIADNGAELLVMAPVLCLQSRVYNVMTLGRDSELSLGQLRASIACTRAYSHELLDALPGDEGPKEVLAINERIAKQAQENPDWIGLPLRHAGIDPFEAVLLDPRLPHGFHDRRYPQLKAAVETSRERLRARRT